MPNNVSAPGSASAPLAVEQSASGKANPGQRKSAGTTRVTSAKTTSSKTTAQTGTAKSAKKTGTTKTSTSPKTGASPKTASTPKAPAKTPAPKAAPVKGKKTAPAANAAKEQAVNNAGTTAAGVAPTAKGSTDKTDTTKAKAAAKAATKTGTKAKTAAKSAAKKSTAPEPEKTTGAPAKASSKNNAPVKNKAATTKNVNAKTNAAPAQTTTSEQAAAPTQATTAAQMPATPEKSTASPAQTAKSENGSAKKSATRRGGRGRSKKSPVSEQTANLPELKAENLPEVKADNLPQPKHNNPPAVKAESAMVATQEHLPAVHTENLPATTTTAEENKEPKNGRRGNRRPRGRKNRTNGDANAQNAARNGQEQTPADAIAAAAEDTATLTPSEASNAPAPKQDTKATTDAEKSTAKPAAKNSAKTAPKATAKAKAGAKRKMFVSVLAGEQVEVVIAEDGQVREYYVEMLHQAKVKGNIYKGVIHNIDPNLQAAFVSYGAVKNGFLQIDEVHPEYYLNPHEPGKGHKYPLMQKVLKAGQEILVQVVKEPAGTKGAFLTSYLSIPGRYLVLTPGREQIGVSRKVGNDTERTRLRDVLTNLNPGPGLGVIVRTASEGASKTNLQRDLRFLKKLWTDVRKKGATEESPALIYQELGLAARAVRDYLTDDVVELWVDDEAMAAQMQEVVDLLFPKRKDILQIYKEQNQSLFERFGLAKQINQVQSREVVLPSGGRLVFDHTEALTAIDINSGRSGGKTNFEDMAFKINLEAAQHIPLQLRLRDIGGQVVVDFIEMRDRAHWREVEKTFRAGMKEDRARHDVGKISSFGLLEVVRQRLGSSAISIASEPCPFCNGTGVRRNMEWQAMKALQDIQQLIRQNNNNSKKIIYEAAGELVLYLLNNKKERLLEMEQEAGAQLELRPGI